MCNLLALHMCDAQGPWNPENVAKYRLNFSVLFGVMRQKLHQVLIGRCSAKSFKKLFDRACIRAKARSDPEDYIVAIRSISQNDTMFLEGFVNHQIL